MAPAPANIRVLVRIRPLNDREKSGAGTRKRSLGRSGILTVSNHSSSGKIDFNSNGSGGGGSGVDDSKDTNGATIFVNSHSTDDLKSVDSCSSSSTTTSNNNTKQFTFDAVHGTRSTQLEVYDSVKGIVEGVVSGYNGTIVAYGQTGSGKTHTVFGKDGNEGAGLIHRSLRDIFQMSTMSQATSAVNKHDELAELLQNDDDDKNNNSTENDESFEAGGTTTTSYKVSFFEIFNERVYDLLSNESLETALAVREDVTNGVYAEGLKEMTVTKPSEAESIISMGEKNRHVSATNMNRTSSRSHAVFVLSIRREHVTEDGLKRVKNSKFTLVDLAGSERQKSTATYGERLKEASMINKSLLTLGHVINALVDKEAGRIQHIPFRNSKLTFLLRDTWGGNSKTCLVATVSPSASCLGETLSTLQFAQRAKLIKNNAVLNEDTCGTVAALQAELAKLRSQVSAASTATLQSGTSHHTQALFARNESDALKAAKRRAERAERKASMLERKWNKDKNVVKSLKRKVHEETMVRKFKERRLDYMQTKGKRSCEDDEEDQVELLKEEIEALQKRLDKPSSEAVEWKVAYDHLKQEVEVRKGSNSADVELEEKNAELEETIDRLHSEKQELESKNQSYHETQEEIESILQGLNRLESAKKAIEAQLQEKEVEVVESIGKLSERDDKITHLEKELNDVSLEYKLQNQTLASRQESLDMQGEELRLMITKYEQKKSSYAKMEELSKEFETKSANTIAKLQAQVQEQLSTANRKQSELVSLRQQLTDATDEKSTMDKSLQATTLQLESQQSRVKEMEEKMEALTKEKDDIIEGLKEASATIAKAFDDKILTLEGDIRALGDEKATIQSEMFSLEDQAAKNSTDVEEKQALILELETTVTRLQDEQQEMEGQINAHESAIESYKKSSANLSEQVEKLTIELEEKDSRHMEMEALSKEIETELEDKIEQERRNVEEQKSIVNTKQDELESVQQKLSFVTDEKEALDEGFRAKSSQLESQQAMSREMEEKMQALIREKDDAINAITENSVSNKSALQEKVETLEMEVNKLGEEKVKIELDKSSLEEQIAQHASKLNEKESQVLELEEKVNSLMSEVREMESLMKTREDDMSEKLSKQSSLLSQAHINVASLEKEKTEMQQRMDMERERYESDSKKIKASLEEQSNLQEKYRGLEQTIEEIKRQREEAEGRAVALESKLESMKSSLKDVQSQHSGHRDSIEKFEASEANLREEIVCLKKEAAFHDETLREITAKLEQSESQCNEALKATENERKLVSSLNNKVSGLQEEKVKARVTYDSKLGKLESKLKSLTKEKEEAENEIELSQESLSAKTTELSYQKSLAAELTEKVQRLEYEHQSNAKKLVEAEKVLQSNKKTQATYDEQVQEMMVEKDALAVELTAIRKEVASADSRIKELEQKKMELEKIATKSNDKTIKAIADLKQVEAMHKESQSQLDAFRIEKEVSYAELEGSVKLLQVENNTMKKELEKLVSSEEKAKSKLQVQDDRFTLLKREKKSLQSEVDSLRGSQDNINEKVRVLGNDKKDLENENRRLKRRIEELENPDCDSSHTTLSAPSLSQSTSSAVYGSIKYQPSEDGDALSSEMDSMLEKMSTQPSNVDESFDESMFLPNIAVDDKENINCTPNSTPFKSDYGPKRRPLSERKNNRTPFNSSRKKIGPSSKKKQKSNWMIYDNINGMIENEK